MCLRVAGGFKSKFSHILVPRLELYKRIMYFSDMTIVFAEQAAEKPGETAKTEDTGKAEEVSSEAKTETAPSS